MPLTLDEGKRAIYIDYEGNKDSAPTLLGWSIGEKCFASIVEPSFATCAKRYRASQVDVQEHKALADAILKKAEEEGRMIVSWSEHDLNVMAQVLEEPQRLRRVYRNAIKTARRWHQKKHGSLPNAATLAYFAELLNFPIPEIFGRGIVGDGLRLVRGQLSSGRTYADLTPAARLAWVKIVKHNRFDLDAMKHIVESCVTA
jgi:hypothetical protein